MLFAPDSLVPVPQGRVFDAMTRWIATTFVFGFSVTAWMADAAEEAGRDRVPSRVLFVGNSYTAGIKGELQKMFDASPHREITFVFIHPGGCTLERHLGDGKTLEQIGGGRWDVVILQEQSQTPAYPGQREKFVAAAVGLDAAVNKAGAETLFYQTWGRRDGDKANAAMAPDYEAMQDLLTAGYAEAARKTKARIAPVGEAWRIVWEKDAELARSLYRGDGSHPSEVGAYLAACVFYIALTGDDPGEVKFEIKLPEGAARVLREAAKEATGSAAAAPTGS